MTKQQKQVNNYGQTLSSRHYLVFKRHKYYLYCRSRWKSISKIFMRRLAIFYLNRISCAIHFYFLCGSLFLYV